MTASSGKVSATNICKEKKWDSVDLSTAAELQKKVRWKIYKKIIKSILNRNDNKGPSINNISSILVI